MTHVEKIHELEDRLDQVKTAGRFITVLVAVIAVWAGGVLGKQLAESDGWDAGYTAGYGAGFDMTCPGEDWQ